MNKLPFNVPEPPRAYRRQRVGFVRMWADRIVFGAMTLVAVVALFNLWRMI